MNIKILVAVGIMLFVVGSVLSIYSGYDYFQIIESQKEYSDTPTSPGSNTPYPGQDFTGWVILIAGLFISGTICVVLSAYKNR